MQQHNGDYYPDSLTKIGERRVGWRVDYLPSDNGKFFAGLFASIFDNEEAAIRGAYNTLGPPVRVEYDVDLPAPSAKVKVGDRVLAHWRGEVGEVLAIDENMVWVKGCHKRFVTHINDLSRRAA